MGAVIVRLVTGLILGMYCQKGQVHDLAIFRKHRLKIQAKITILADLVFPGIGKHHKNRWIRFNKRKNKSLTKSGKQPNQKQARQRVACENTNRDCKIFRILKQVYRDKHKIL